MYPILIKVIPRLRKEPCGPDLDSGIAITRSLALLALLLTTLSSAVLFLGEWVSAQALVSMAAISAGIAATL